MKNCYDCNHCEICRWIDEFRDKDVCSFYEDGTPLNEVLGKIRAELHATAEMHEDENYYLREKWIDKIIDKCRKEQKDDI